MPERLIPISKKQHDAFNALTENAKAIQSRMEVMANTLLMSIEEDIGEVQVTGAECRDGVYSLVVNVPEPAAQDSTG